MVGSRRAGAPRAKHQEEPQMCGPLSVLLTLGIL
jgi:hypothetical protein